MGKLAGGRIRSARGRVAWSAALTAVAAVVATGALGLPPVRAASQPGAPTIKSVAPGGVGKIVIKWSAPSPDPNPPVMEYLYQLATTKDAGRTWSAYGDALSLGSKAGSKSVKCPAVKTAAGGCKVRLYARSDWGTSWPSAAGWTLWQPPGAPGGGSATGRSGTPIARVTWSAPGKTGGLAITGYRWQVSTDGGATWPTAPVTFSLAARSGVVNPPATCIDNSSCRYRVYAVNAAGVGPAGKVFAASWAPPDQNLGVATGTPYVPSGMSESTYWDRTAALGVGWVRLDCIPSSYTSYTSCDDSAWQAQRIHARLVVTLTYRPGSKFGDGTFSATERQQWAVWAANTAAHLEAAYPGVVGAYEIWNEPNNAHFWGPVDPNAYADLLARASFGIRSKVAKPILVGGLSPGGTNGPAWSTADPSNPATFLDRIYSIVGGGLFDAVAQHPYDTRSQYTNYQGSGYRATHWVRRTMNDHGDSAKKIWATEAGTASCIAYPEGTKSKMSESARVKRLQGDVNDWFHGVHDPGTGATVGSASASDWNTGPFMVFKLYKQYDGAGLGLSYVGGKCGWKPWSDPPVVDALVTLARS